MWIFLIIRDRKKKNFTESRKVFCFFAGGVLASFALGWSPYITNIYRYHEFLPAIFGDAPKATGSFTVSTAGMNAIQIFWINIFSKIGDYWDVQKLPLKIPFTVSREELMNYYIYAPQFGTFGMLFSGMFLIAMILLFIILIRYRKRFQEDRLKVSFVLWTVIFLHCMICPVGIGGLRYVAHFYVIFVYAVILGFYFFSQKRTRILLYALCVAAAVNIAPYIHIYGEGMAEKRRSDKILEAAAPYAGRMEIALSTKDFYGMLFNLKDKGIKLEDYKLLGSEEIGEDVSYACGWQIKFKIIEN